MQRCARVVDPKGGSGGCFGLNFPIFPRGYRIFDDAMQKIAFLP